MTKRRSRTITLSLTREELAVLNSIARSARVDVDVVVRVLLGVAITRELGAWKAGKR